MLRIGAKHEGRIADPLHEFGIAAFAEFRDQRIAGCTVSDPDLHLNEFMVVQRALVFGEQRFRQARIADHDDGFQLVSKATKVFFLMFAKHAGECSNIEHSKRALRS